jgi:hypothetical protein
MTVDESNNPGSEVDSGTGWPSGHTKQIKSGTAELPVVEPKADRPRRGLRPWQVFRWGRRAFWLALVAAAVVIVVLVAGLVGALPHLSNPFAKEKVDKSQPVLLLSIQDLARFEAASGNYQVIIDVQEDRRFIPDIIFSQRSLFVAAGSVDAYVDFSNVPQSDVIVSPDRKTVTVNLPAPQLETPNIDPNRSYVYESSEGLINHIQDMFGGDKNKEGELFQLAQQKIAAAALDSGLLQRAQANTKQMLEELLRSLGFTTITINFPPSS